MGLTKRGEKGKRVLHKLLYSHFLRRLITKKARVYKRALCCLVKQTRGSINWVAWLGSSYRVGEAKVLAEKNAQKTWLLFGIGNRNYCRRIYNNNNIIDTKNMRSEKKESRKTGTG